MHAKHAPARPQGHVCLRHPCARPRTSALRRRTTANHGELKGPAAARAEEPQNPQEVAKTVFGIEYERHGETRPDVAKCLAFIDKVAAQLAG